MNIAPTHLEYQLTMVEELGWPTVLPNLQFLAVNLEYDPTVVRDNIKFVHAPSLISLSPTGWDSDDEALDSSILGETHFPALQHLLLGSSVDAASIEFDLLAKAYPNIERLTYRIRMECEDIRNVLGYITEPGEELRWPKLKTKKYCDVQSVLHFNAELLGGLYQLIMKFQQTGRPFHQILYPISGACIALADAGDIHKLRQFVKLEDFRDDWSTPFRWTA